MLAPSKMPLVDRAHAITSLLRDADLLVARALDLLGRGGVEAVTGLAPEMLLALDARLTGSDARFMVHAASVLQEMPYLKAAFDNGAVSWGQVRSIVCAVGRVRAVDRDQIDEMIGVRAAGLQALDPEQLVHMVDREVERRTPDLTLKREDRVIKTSFLAIQGRIDGGGTFYGEAGPEDTATLVEALDLLADDPVHADDGLGRGEQRFEALIYMCEATLSGQTGGSLRPRPRFLATFDVAGLTDDQRDQGMSLLWGLTGRAPRLSKVAKEMLLCDATIVPVIFDGPNPIEVGDAANTFSDKVRNAIAARDQRCRFCSRAPAPWCDAHHIVEHTGNKVNDGCLLCRRCHRRVHRYNWAMKINDDASILFKRGRQQFISLSPP